MDDDGCCFINLASSRMASARCCPSAKRLQQLGCIIALFHLNVSFKISFQEEFRTFGCFLKFWPETEGYVLNGQFQNLPQAEIFGNSLK